ncbi:MAG: hypothetical protein WC776_05375 [Patescibacteria group bacterium]|jgi:hypothetical protein
MNTATHFLVPLFSGIIIATIVRSWIRNKCLRLLNRFREVGANDQDHAIPLREIPEKESWIFDRLVNSEVVVTACDGRCFLDEDALKRHRTRNHATRLIVIGVGFAVGLGVFLLSYFVFNPK